MATSPWINLFISLTKWLSHLISPRGNRCERTVDFILALSLEHVPGINSRNTKICEAGDRLSLPSFLLIYPGVGVGWQASFTPRLHPRLESGSWMSPGSETLVSVLPQNPCRTHQLRHLAPWLKDHCRLRELGKPQKLLISLWKLLSENLQFLVKFKCHWEGCHFKDYY